jgi:hypothetical protein
MSVVSGNVGSPDTFSVKKTPLTLDDAVRENPVAERHSPSLTIACYFGRDILSDEVNYRAFSGLGHADFSAIAISTARARNLSCQLASKLALEKYADVLFNSVRRHRFHKKQERDPLILEDVFLQTNDYIYRFAHKLAAGGKTSASLVGVLWGPHAVSVARAASGSVFLVRDEQLFPFFDDTMSVYDIAYLGVTHNPVLDFSSVQAKRGDLVLLFSERMSDILQRNLVHLIDRVSLHYKYPDQLARWLFPRPEEQKFVVSICYE